MKGMQEGMWSLYIFIHSHNYQGGKSSYKALMLDIKQVLSNMLNHEATQVPHATTNAFLTLQLLHILISVSLTAGDVTGHLHTCVLQLLY